MVLWPMAHGEQLTAGLQTPHTPQPTRPFHLPAAAAEGTGSMAFWASSATRALARVACRRLFQRRSLYTPYTFGRHDGKVVVVCGAGNPPMEGLGIGATTAVTFARHGAKVVSVSNAELNAQTVNSLIVDEGHCGLAHVADCRNGDEVQALVDRVVAEWGRVDTVVNAGWTADVRLVICLPDFTDPVTYVPPYGCTALLKPGVGHACGAFWNMRVSVG